jgi:TRAP-type C4-dicarboxylate transport system substrate-binding protein
VRASCLVIVNTEKLATLPAKVQDLVHSAYDVTETSVKEAQRINDALFSELILTVQE